MLVLVALLLGGCASTDEVADPEQRSTIVPGTVVSTAEPSAAQPVATTPSPQPAPTVDSALISVGGSPPLFDGNEGTLGGPLFALGLQPDEVDRAGDTWGVTDAVDLSSAEEQPVTAIPRPSQPTWYALCLSYDAGGRYCDVALVDSNVTYVNIDGAGSTAVTCADGTIVAMTDVQQAPAEICG